MAPLRFSDVSVAWGHVDQSHNHTATRMKGLGVKGPPAHVPNSHRRRIGRSYVISLLASLAALVWISGYLRGTEPTAYALCSPYGTTNIYTVDANDTKAQCLVVRGERFLYTSAYSAYVENHSHFEKLTRPLC
jgi:hypothetical protein